VDWMHLANDKDQWRALVNTVMNFSGYIKCSKFLDYLTDYQLLKKDSASWN
jgi:hypothetical protein